MLAALSAGCGAQVMVVAPLRDPGANRPQVVTAHVRSIAAYEVGRALAPARFEAAVTGARAVTARSLAAFAADAPEVLQAAARHAYEAGRVDDGWAFYQGSRAAGVTGAESFALHAGAQLQAERYARAREASFDGLDLHPDHRELRLLADRSIDEDPVLIPPVVRALTPQPGHVLKALGGGSTVTLKLEVNDEKVAAVKPDQDLGQSMYRSEIAYYRLCHILRCRFRVPYNEEVRVSRSDFKVLWGRVDTPKQRGYASKFGHLIWKPDADGTEYLYATFKEWVPAFVSFPVEASSAWKKYLTAGASDQRATPVTEWLPTLAEAAGPRGWDRHKRRLAYAEGIDLHTLLAQISDFLAVDFLTNNWDRFSGGVELYGANCHLEPGGLVAIDNGASFPPWHTDRVSRRLHLSQKFSRRLIAAVRRLEHDRTLIRLFPNPTADELKRFEVFWERRTQLLDYVDGLIAKHGEEAVLAF